MAAKLIIGIVGQKGGGKETFVELLAKNLPTRSVEHIRFSDLLAETLALWSLPSTRANLQQLAISMNQGFGLGTLTRAIIGKIKASKADIVCVDGVRWLSDVEMIRSFKKNRLVYVTANIATRYARTKARKEKAGESMTTYEQFVAEEKARTEVEISKIAAGADVTITNDGTLADLEEQVKQWLIHDDIA